MGVDINKDIDKISIEYCFFTQKSKYFLFNFN